MLQLLLSRQETSNAGNKRHSNIAYSSISRSLRVTVRRLSGNQSVMHVDRTILVWFILYAMQGNRLTPLSGNWPDDYNLAVRDQNQRCFSFYFIVVSLILAIQTLKRYHISPETFLKLGNALFHVLFISHCNVLFNPHSPSPFPRTAPTKKVPTAIASFSEPNISTNSTPTQKNATGCQNYKMPEIIGLPIAASCTYGSMVPPLTLQ